MVPMLSYICGIRVEIEAANKRILAYHDSFSHSGEKKSINLEISRNRPKSGTCDAGKKACDRHALIANL